MPNDTDPLSLKKADYINEGVYTERPLTLEQAYILAEEYNRKHHITIYVSQHLAEKNIPVETFFTDVTLDLNVDINVNVHADMDVDVESDSEETEEEEFTLENDTAATRKALNSILSIQKTLQPNQYVGFLFTAVDAGMGHFECFIISQDQIIKPVSWFISEFASTNPNVMGELFLKAPQYHYSWTELKKFCNQALIPQADCDSCGSLCLSYLKNMLKDNARQIRDMSLSVPYFNDNDELQYFFVPPPNVLRYTQMPKYNQYIEKMIKLDRNTRTNTSLKSQLTATLQKIKQLSLAPDEKERITAQTEACLHYLPEFKRKWLDEYALISAKRELMMYPGERYNRYLIYTANRYMIRASLIEQPQINPGLSTLRTLQDMSSSSLDEKKDFLQRSLQQIAFSDLLSKAYFLYCIDNKLHSFCLILFLQKDKNPYLKFDEYLAFLSTSHKKELRRELRSEAFPDFLAIIQLEPNWSSSIFDWFEQLDCSLQEKRQLTHTFIPTQLAETLLIEKINKQQLPSSLYKLHHYEIKKFIRQYNDIVDHRTALKLFSKRVMLTCFENKNSGKVDLIDLLTCLYDVLPENQLKELLSKYRLWFISSFLTSDKCYVSDPTNLPIILSDTDDKKSLFEKLHPILTEIRFFCPDNNPPVIALYQTHWISDPNRDENDIQLTHILSMIPLAERYDFMWSIFNNQAEDAIAKYGLFSLFLNKKEPLDLDLDLTDLNEEVSSNAKPDSSANKNVSSNATSNANTDASSAKKRPFGQISDLDFFFFAYKSVKEESNDGLQQTSEPHTL